MKMDRKRIGERLVKLRGNRTQEQVAKALGISTSALAMYESGKRVPRDEVKLAIAEFYKSSIQEIFFAA